MENFKITINADEKRLGILCFYTKCFHETSFLKNTS